MYIVEESDIEIFDVRPSKKKLMSFSAPPASFLAAASFFKTIYYSEKKQQKGGKFEAKTKFLGLILPKNWSRLYFHLCSTTAMHGILY